MSQNGPFLDPQLCNIALKEAKVGPERVQKATFASFKVILQIDGPIWVNSQNELFWTPLVQYYFKGSKRW